MTPTGLPRTGLAPGPALALLAAGVTLAMVADHPVVLGVLALGAGAVLALSAGRRAWPLVVAGLATAAGLAVITPFVAAQGDLILLDGPAVPLFDTQVTLEEILGGLVVGLRVLAVTLLVGGLLAAVDQDRLLGAAMRLAPRSAMSAALAARALPALERDAHAISEAARARGARLSAGPWTGRARAAGGLVVPLLGSGLERGLDVAEAMTARGYGSGPRTRHPDPAADPRDRLALAAAVLLAGLAVTGLVADVVAYRVYPRAEWALGAAPLLAAAVVAVALGAAALAVRR